MFNLFFKIFTLVIILSTLGILATKPKMHNKVLVFNSEYMIVENDDNTNSTNTISEKIELQMPQKQAVSETKKELYADKIEAKKDIKSEKQVNKQVYEPKKVQQQNKIQNVVKEEKPIVKPVAVKQTQNVVKKQETAPSINVIKPAVKNETAVVVQQKPQQPKQLTQQEEQIAWNVWRSNLQNQIMKDVKLPYVPKGTVFKFSFDVDKYGKISSVKAWSLTPNYTPYAIQYIAPVIRSYQGKDILDFPIGTQRLTTKVEGGWKISDNAVYSTPQDYHDVEKVKK